MMAAKRRRSESFRVPPSLRSRMRKNTEINCQYWWTDCMRGTAIIWLGRFTRTRRDTQHCSRRFAKSKQVNGTKEYSRRMRPQQTRTAEPPRRIYDQRQTALAPQNLRRNRRLQKFPNQIWLRIYQPTSPLVFHLLKPKHDQRVWL
jgi:hypothetical protein